MGRISHFVIVLLLVAGSADAATVIGSAKFTSYSTNRQAEINGRVVLAGVAGGQTINGGTAASESLTLSSTTHATKGKLLFGTSAYDEVNNRLGIGTASPTNTINVSKSENSNVLVNVLNSNSGASARAGMQVQNNIATGLFFQMEGSAFSLGAGYELLAADSGVFGTGGSNGMRLITSAAAPIILGTSGYATANERMRVDSSGNVGINTASPSGRLDVHGSGSTTGVCFQTANSDGTAKFTIQDNGVVINGNVNRLKNYTVATLPAGTQGDTAFVTDASAPTFLATVVGGGAVVTPVFFNGTNWIGF